MERLDTSRLAEIIAAAPEWARLGLGVRDDRVRERAADVIAAILANRLATPEPADTRQLMLPIP